VSVTPSCLVLIGVILACRFEPLKVGKVEGLLRVRNKLAFFEIRHVVEIMFMNVLFSPQYCKSIYIGSANWGRSTRSAVADWRGIRVMWGGVALPATAGLVRIDSLGEAKAVRRYEA
jgi:hypothetical protein